MPVQLTRRVRGPLPEDSLLLPGTIGEAVRRNAADREEALLRAARVRGPMAFAPRVGALYEWWAGQALHLPSYLDYEAGLGSAGLAGGDPEEDAEEEPRSLAPDLARRNGQLFVEVKAARGPKSGFKIYHGQLARYEDFARPPDPADDCPFAAVDAPVRVYYLLVEYQFPGSVTADPAASLWPALETVAAGTRWALLLDLRLFRALVDAYAPPRPGWSWNHATDLLGALGLLANSRAGHCARAPEHVLAQTAAAPALATKRRWLPPPAGPDARARLPWPRVPLTAVAPREDSAWLARWLRGLPWREEGSDEAR